VSAIPKRPLYVLAQRFLDTATQQLKRASDHDLKVASIEVEVAWMLIVSLMSLGPNFVRPHLLVLWRNVCACVDAAARAPTLSPPPPSCRGWTGQPQSATHALSETS